MRPFRQVDVFTSELGLGNPVAVVLDGRGLSTAQMQGFTNWTNLSEATFVLPPSTSEADYRVRIFAPFAELPFAGHPTLGTCHAWLEHGGRPAREDVVVQECGVGLVPVRRTDTGLAFAAPPLRRSGAVDEAEVAELTAILGLTPDDVVAAAWIDNGPGWVGLLLRDAETVLRVWPSYTERTVGVAGRHPPGAAEQLEVRAFFAQHHAMVEDPVTGSLNASLAQWLTASGRIEAPYTARQGTALGRAGLVRIEADDAGIWVGGACVTGVVGRVAL